MCYAAGGTAHLAGVIEAKTTCRFCAADPLEIFEGMDSLLSTVQMPTIVMLTLKDIQLAENWEITENVKPDKSRLRHYPTCNNAAEGV